MSQEPNYVGIDVSKERIDVAVRPTGRSWSVSYDGADVDDLVAQLKDLRQAGVITESTGGLELPLVAALAAASLPVAVVNSCQVRDFAKSTGQLAKTDRLDAQVLAYFGEAVRPPMRPFGTTTCRPLGAALARRRQVMDVKGGATTIGAAEKCTSEPSAFSISVSSDWFNARLGSQSEDSIALTRLLCLRR